MEFMEQLTVDGVRDGIQVLLCLLVLGCLACNRLTSVRESQARTTGRVPFADEVGLQGLRQQTEQALTAIQRAVEAERRRLERWMTGTDAGREPVVADAEPADLIPFRLGEGAPGAADRYDALPRLAAGGLTTRELATRTRLPAGEIELALKLRRLDA
jgi:hypothetical protein